MAKNSSATTREHTSERSHKPHAKQTTRIDRRSRTARPTRTVGGISTAGPTRVTGTTQTSTIINALRQREIAILNDESLDDQSRATIRQGLERNDPWLAELVRCGDAGNSINETSEFNSKEQTNSDYSTSNGCSETNDDSPEADSDCSDGERIDALADIICGAGEECAGALLVLMGMIANSGQPEVLAHTVKHLALTRCVELNVFGMVDAQIAEVERQLSAK